MINDGHSAPYKPGGVAPPGSIGTGDLLPRLRLLLIERDYSRAAACRHMGLHANTLQRLNDMSWQPRLDTILRIEEFLRHAEANPDFRVGPRHSRRRETNMQETNIDTDPLQ